MIIELAAAGAIALISAAAVFRTVAALLAGRARAGSRLPAAGVRGSGEDHIYALGGRAMDLIPKAWSAWLDEKFGRRVAETLAAADMAAVGPRAFIGTQIILGALGFAAAFPLAGGGVFGLMGGFAAGYGAARGLLFHAEGRGGRRALDFARLLPEFVDLLAIGVEAGLSLDRAIHLYCERFDNALARAFSSALIEMELGKARRQALLELAGKHRNDDLNWFVSSILQAEKLGSPLAQALHEQARAARERQSQLVKEFSATAPVKMLFPIAGLILPALLIMVMGPAFLQFIR